MARRWNHKTKALLLASAVFGSGYSPAMAQEGVALGRFLLLPSAELRETYNDNIYTEPNSEVSDYITTVQPTLLLNSNFPSHALNFLATGNFGFYADNSENDFADYALATDGRFDIGQSTNIFGGARYDRLHEDRGSRNNQNGLEPIEYSLTTLNGGASHIFADKLSLRGTVTHSLFDYDAQSRQNNTSVPQDFRDREQTEPTLRVGYRLNPNFEIFTRGSYNTRDYDQTLDTTGRRRSSDGHQVVAGVGIGYPGKFSGEFFAGAMEQNYDDAALKDVSTATYGWTWNWVPTNRVSITSNLNRTIDETTTLAASSQITSSVGLFADIDLSRSLILRPEVTYVNTDYQGIAQEDDLVILGLGLSYELTDNFYVGPGYRYSERDSNVQTSDYSQHAFFLRLGARL